MTDAPLRIALVTDTYAPQLNGVARTLARTVEAMRARDHDVHVFTAADPDAMPDARVHQFRGRPFWAYPQLRVALPKRREMIAAFRAFQPDVVHLATPFGLGLAGRAAARRMRVPMLSSYHTSLATYAKFYGLGALSGIGWWYLRWFHNSTARTLCPTRAICDELASHDFQRLGLWARGVDTDAFHPRRRSDALRTSWGATEDTVVLAYIGRLAAEKGVGVALDAMRSLVESGANVVCVVVGEGPYEEECRRRAPRGTIFTGRLDGAALGAAFASADVFAFPSVTDTFGNVVQEAMASRLAVVAADVPQTREVLAGTGIVAPPDAAAFASAIGGLVASRSALVLVRDRARAVAETRSWESVFDGLEREYFEVARGPIR